MFQSNKHFLVDQIKEAQAQTPQLEQDVARIDEMLSQRRKSASEARSVRDFEQAAILEGQVNALQKMLGDAQGALAAHQGQIVALEQRLKEEELLEHADLLSQQLAQIQQEFQDGFVYLRNDLAVGIVGLLKKRDEWYWKRLDWWETASKMGFHYGTPPTDKLRYEQLQFSQWLTQRGINVDSLGQQAPGRPVSDYFNGEPSIQAFRPPESNGLDTFTPYLEGFLVDFLKAIWERAETLWKRTSEYSDTSERVTT